MPVKQAEIWRRIDELRAEVENAARYSDDGSEQIELAERILERIQRKRVDDEVAAELQRKRAEDVRV